MSLIKKKYSNESSNSSYIEIASYITSNTITLIQAKGSSFNPIPRTEYSKLLGLATRVKKFSTLLPNWDSYGAAETTQDAINSAYSVIERLAIDGLLINKIDIHVFPMRDGGIQFEFDEEDLSFELEITPKGEFTFIEYNEEGEVIDEYKDFNLSDLKEKILALEYA